MITARPIWITLDELTSLAQGERGAVQALADKFSVAPEDSVEVVAAKLNEIDIDAAFRDQPWYVVAPHVLRALGKPDD